jgi:hypothetical protein
MDNHLNNIIVEIIALLKSGHYRFKLNEMKEIKTSLNTFKYYIRKNNFNDFVSYDEVRNIGRMLENLNEENFNSEKTLRMVEEYKEFQKLCLQNLQQPKLK